MGYRGNIVPIIRTTHVLWKRHEKSIVNFHEFREFRMAGLVGPLLQPDGVSDAGHSEVVCPAGSLLDFGFARRKRIHPRAAETDIVPIAAREGIVATSAKNAVITTTAVDGVRA